MLPLLTEVRADTTAIANDPCPSACEPIKAGSSKVWAKVEVPGLLLLSFVAVVFHAWGEEEEEEGWGRCVVMKGCSFMEADDPLLILIITPCSQPPTGF